MSGSPLIDLASRIESQAPGNPELGAAKEFLHFIDRRIVITKNKLDKAQKEGDFRVVARLHADMRNLKATRKKTESDIHEMESRRGGSRRKRRRRTKRRRTRNRRRRRRRKRTKRRRR